MRTCQISIGTMLILEGSIAYLSMKFLDIFNEMRKIFSEKLEENIHNFPNQFVFYQRELCNVWRLVRCSSFIRQCGADDFLVTERISNEWAQSTLYALKETCGPSLLKFYCLFHSSLKWVLQVSEPVPHSWKCFRNAFRAFPFYRRF